MQNILETVMLICFGLSWPINFIKSLKTKTAKSTSLPFYLLITVGYIAGIAAKFIGGNINYVLIAYFINILFVILNICVYFRNKTLDKRNMNNA